MGGAYTALNMLLVPRTEFSLITPVIAGRDMRFDLVILCIVIGTIVLTVEGKCFCARSMQEIKYIATKWSINMRTVLHCPRRQALRSVSNGDCSFRPTFTLLSSSKVKSSLNTSRTCLHKTRNIGTCASSVVLRYVGSSAWGAKNAVLTPHRSSLVCEISNTGT